MSLQGSENEIVYISKLLPLAPYEYYWCNKHKKRDQFCGWALKFEPQNKFYCKPQTTTTTKVELSQFSSHSHSISSRFFSFILFNPHLLGRHMNLTIKMKWVEVGRDNKNSTTQSLLLRWAKKKSQRWSPKGVDGWDGAKNLSHFFRTFMSSRRL